MTSDLGDGVWCVARVGCLGMCMLLGVWGDGILGFLDGGIGESNESTSSKWACLAAARGARPVW